MTDHSGLDGEGDGFDTERYEPAPLNGHGGDGDFGIPIPPIGSDDPDLDRLNGQYCVVRDGGKTRVLHFERHVHRGHERHVASYFTFEDFRNFHLNKRVRVGDKDVPLGHWWLKHPGRRQYEGLVFQPGQTREVEGRLNLWRGWGVQPARGDWSLMKRHIREALTANDQAAHDYILKWMAWSVQHPAERAQAAIVFRGAQGTGKGSLGNLLCRVFGQHGCHISSAEHLSGRFNGHLRDACFLFADEAYWPGDKGAEGSLKRLVTEPDLFVELKGRDGVMVPNMLHIMMASNEKWVVPAGDGERRYAVFEVSECFKKDRRWFDPLYRQMERGGCAAMLHDLLEMRLGEWHPREVPHTQALVEQQAHTLRPEDAWWVELLETGVLWGADPQQPNRALSHGVKNGDDAYAGGRPVQIRGVLDQAREIAPGLKPRSDHFLATILTNNGCTNGHKIMRRRGWEFPPLGAARAAWEQRFPGWRWRDPALRDWQEDG